jgi:hypothetical protein
MALINEHIGEMDMSQTLVIKSRFNWINGTIADRTDITFQAKVYAEPSEYGIGDPEGRVSKLEIRQDNKTIVHYDRGWGMNPSTADAKMACDIILAAFA